MCKKNHDGHGSWRTIMFVTRRDDFLCWLCFETCTVGIKWNLYGADTYSTYLHTYMCPQQTKLLRALNDRLTVCAVRPTITYVFGLQKPCNRNCKYLYHRSADWKWQWSVVHSCPNLYLLSQKSDMSCPVPLNVFSGQTDRQQLTRRPVSEGANFAVASLTVNDS